MIFLLKNLIFFKQKNLLFLNICLTNSASAVKTSGWFFVLFVDILILYFKIYNVKFWPTDPKKVKFNYSWTLSYISLTAASLNSRIGSLSVPTLCTQTHHITPMFSAYLDYITRSHSPQQSINKYLFINLLYNRWKL